MRVRAKDEMAQAGCYFLWLSVQTLNELPEDQKTKAGYKRAGLYPYSTQDGKLVYTNAVTRQMVDGQPAGQVQSSTGGTMTSKFSRSPESYVLVGLMQGRVARQTDEQAQTHDALIKQIVSANGLPVVADYLNHVTRPDSDLPIPAVYASS